MIWLKSIAGGFVAVAALFVFLVLLLLTRGVLVRWKLLKAGYGVDLNVLSGISVSIKP